MSGRTADTLTHAAGMGGVVGPGQVTTGEFPPQCPSGFSLHSCVGHPWHWQWLLQLPRELLLVSSPRRSLSDVVVAAWFDAPGAEMAAVLPTVRVCSANPVVPGTTKKHKRGLLKGPKSIVRLLN